MYNIYLIDEGAIAVPSWINSFIVRKSFPEAIELKKKLEFHKESLWSNLRI